MGNRLPAPALIARRGGGIHASVRDLRSRGEDELFALAAPRLMRLAASGVTTVEVKSGYGLSLDDELKTLRVVRRLAEALPPDPASVTVACNLASAELRL